VPRNGREPSYTAYDLQRALTTIARASFSDSPMLGTERVATMPEPRPVPPPMAAQTALGMGGGTGQGMGGTMFGLSPEDLARGEPPEPEAENGSPDRFPQRDHGRSHGREAGRSRDRSTRGPSPQHGLSPEDQRAEEEKPKD
jgi:hypothetical protein